ncbi:MAG: hypothetical protein HGA61_00855 [Candidatus Moranbacteria bacterium]|nr:hypothetical protein [Candidatus Moranbacteria bacterium]
MKKFLKNQREYIAVVIFFGIFFILGYFVIVPLLAKVASIKNEIEEATNKQDIKKQRLSELPKLRQQYEEIKNQQGKIDVLLSKKQAVNLIEKIEKLAQETNNEVVISIQDDLQKQAPVPVSAKPNSAEISLENSLPSKNYLKLKIDLIGDYENLVKFINNLETMEYYSDIIGISIRPSIEGSFATEAKNSDVLNPFSSGTYLPKLTTSKKVAGKLLASWEVVFYSKE